MEITLPQLAFAVLIGPSGSGKSHFAAHHLPADEVVRLADVAALLGDDGSRPELREETLALLHRIVELRLQHRKPCVIDGDFISQKSRSELRRLGRKYHIRLQAIVMDTPLDRCAERNASRPGSPDRQAIRKQMEGWEDLDATLQGEGITSVTRVPEGADVVLRRPRARSDKRADHGPFDVVGDVHGCIEELQLLLGKLGYISHAHPETGRPMYTHPEGRKLVFVGDLCDRGPDSPAVLRLVMDAVRDGNAHCVPGNHDDKLMRWLSGNKVQLKHGLERTVAQLEGAAPAFLEEAKAFINGMSSHIELDGGRLVVAHAGIKASMHGRSSGEIHAFCLYGETTGETDEFGLPVRYNWAGEYTGEALVVYGHTPVPEPLWQGNTVNIDTGCVFGGALTALRYPERITVAVDAIAEHSRPTRPLHWVDAKRASSMPELSLDGNVIHPKMLLSTTDGYHLNLEPAAYQFAAGYVAREAVQPRWVIYLPTPCSPVTSSSLPGLLEHPAQAFDYYRKKGVSGLAVRPMPHGTPVVLVLCRDAEVAARRFGVRDGSIGCLYTGPARPYLRDAGRMDALLRELAEKLEFSGLWDSLHTDWLCLEGVASPLSEAAPTFDGEVLAPVTATGLPALAQAQARLQAAGQRGVAVTEPMRQLAQAQQRLQAFGAARQHVAGKPAPRIHLLQVIAMEGQNWMGKSKLLHLPVLEAVAAAWGGGFEAIPLWEGDTDSDLSQRAITAQWEELNAGGGAEILVGPMTGPALQKEESPQSGLKVRCKEHLRLIYGPDYDAPTALEAHRARNLRLKRETTLRLDAIARDAVGRFLARRSASEVFHCPFMMLGLSLRTIDPRL